MESTRSGDVIRERTLAGVLGFVRAVAPLAGVRRIALVGSIMTAKPTPKDVDLLVTVTDDADLAPLAQCARQLQGRLQGLNHWVDVFLARRRFLRSLAIGLGMAVGFTITAEPAAAQRGRGIDVAAGYLVASHYGIRNGWNVQATVPVSRRWSVVGEVDGYDRTGDVESRLSGSVSRTSSHRTARAGLGGVRFQWQTSTNVFPFWQVLAGTVRETAHVENFSNGRRNDRTSGTFSSNSEIFQAGAGVTLMPHHRFGVRVYGGLQVGEDDVFWLPRAAIDGVVRLTR